MALLEVRNLSVEFETTSGRFRAVDGFDLTLQKGDITAIVGESGSGKSVAFLAMMGLLPWTATITSDVLKFPYICFAGFARYKVHPSIWVQAIVNLPLSQFQSKPCQPKSIYRQYSFYEY